MAQSPRGAVDPVVRERLVRRAGVRLKILGASIGAIALAFVVIYFAAPQRLLCAEFAREAMAAHLAKHSVRVGDTRWVYYEGGNGPPLMLLHGYTGSKENWLLAARDLTPNFRVIVPDLPGWGESTRLADADYGYAAQVARLDAFADALHLGAFALAGHSMGGAIAGLYAAAHPQRVAALVLLDSAGLPFRENDFTRELKAGRNPFDYDDGADFTRMQKSLFADPPWLPPRIADVFVARSIRDRAFDDRVMRAIAAPDQRDALQAQLPKIDAPVLAIWCRQDRIIDVSAVDALRTGLTHAPKIGVTEFNGCGHMSIMERPREVADTITRFVLAP